jgi:hypothetical protein
MCRFFAFFCTCNIVVVIALAYTCVLSSLFVEILDEFKHEVVCGFAVQQFAIIAPVIREGGNA